MALPETYAMKTETWNKPRLVLSKAIINGKPCGMFISATHPYHGWRICCHVRLRTVAVSRSLDYLLKQGNVTMPAETEATEQKRTAAKP